MRISFIIDGFNLYHSICDLIEDRPGTHAKWLDIRSLCSEFLPSIDTSATISTITYCTSYPYHRVTKKDPDKVKRHKAYVECLKDTGINVQEGHFKKRTIKREFNIWGNKISLELIEHEEKETDVAIACLMLIHLMDSNIDAVFLLTGDTDLTPVIKIAKMKFSNKPIYVLFPYNRHNHELKKLADKSFNLNSDHYIKYQFSDPYIMTNKSRIQKPPGW